ncbi:hypothetical protein DH2020_003631 [Rehmannia glutinosa]|uniref:Protein DETOXIFICATION n=1 Tax=Rehmannia glutinosa TaxID=99300 RepID=A0ABR0XMC6_REHGL
MEHNSTQPLLADAEDHDQDESSDIISSGKYLVQLLSNHSFFSSFIVGEDDIPPITGVAGFLPAFKKESSKLWHLAGPAILTSIFQYSLGAVTQIFAGHVGTLDLAAFSIENTVIAGLCLGITLGNGKCTETLSAGKKAFGAGRIDMLGVYMQRSWGYSSLNKLFANVYVHICGTIIAIARAMDDISRLAGNIRSDDPRSPRGVLSNLQVLASSKQDDGNGLISAMVLALHDFDCSNWGIAGGALVLNASWWLLVVAQMIYIISGACGKAWTGFSWKAFENLWGFVRLSVASAVMLCLEIWYFTALILFAGYLKNAEVSVDALSICGALSINGGVAVGAGWQALVAYVNIACYYLFGVPLGLILGYTLKMGVQGIWYGMVVGTVVQTIILFWIVYKTNRNKEASIAGKRIKKWRGDPNDKENDLEK